MDIDLLSKMVKELILDQDRVVLPGLGSFVAEVVPSTFSDKGYTINPPYRRLFFRSKPDEGDDLTSFYASSNNVELDLADRIIKEFISELKSVLHEKKTVVFPGLGRLRATKENHVFFVADESLDIYPAGFGLEPISLKTHQETAEEVAAAVEGLKTLLKEPTPAPEPAPAPVPEPAVVPEPMPDPAPQPVPPSAPAAPSAPGHVRKSRTGLRLSVGLAAAAAVLLVAYMIIGRTRPDLVDPFLYTPEELEIVKML
jgi:nucleoid DNA-binding protein